MQARFLTEPFCFEAVILTGKQEDGVLLSVLLESMKQNKKLPYFPRPKLNVALSGVDAFITAASENEQSITVRVLEQEKIIKPGERINYSLPG